MKFIQTKLKGVYIIELELIKDERGFFSRSFCHKEFEKMGVDFTVVQSNISYNKKKGTLRGLHYQNYPYEEAKLVSCIRGAIYDVIVDLQHDSPTYCQWFAVELSAQSYKMLYVPKGFAHGFQTLENNTVVFYQMSEFYHPERARGVRWDDPVFEIRWPIERLIVSSKDQSYKPFKVGMVKKPVKK